MLAYAFFIRVSYPSHERGDSDVREFGEPQVETSTGRPNVVGGEGS